MKSQDLAKLKLPAKPGAYFFRKGKDILYIGKATSLRDRTKSYFSKDLINTRGPSIVDMAFKADTVTWEATDSVLEALILEAELIRRYQPYYNVKEKDGKSFLCVCITKSALPLVVTIRKKDINFETKTAFYGRGGKEEIKLDAIYGPFTSGLLLKDAMRIIRRIFPYMDGQSSKRDNYEFYKQVGLAPELITTPNPLLHKEGVKASPPYGGGDGRGGDPVESYKKNIRHLKLFFQGKKKEIVKSLKKDMTVAAKAQQFEEAGRIRNQIFALDHINDTALIKYDFMASSHELTTSFRIEAYDIAHMSGKNMVGVMTVLVNGTPDKNEYRKFIIRTQTGSNDTGALEEVFSRRLRHNEWGMPDLIVIDGGVGQMNVAKQVLFRYQMKIPVVAVVKDDSHKAREILGDKENAERYPKEILLANSEAHRFAITFHKLKRNKNFLPQ